jgi:capsular polysaccharide biosynthesis protein
VRGGAEVARWAHNPKVIGSSPIPATKESSELSGDFVFKIDANLFSYSKFLIQRNSSVFVIITGSIPIAIGTIPATKESSELSGDFVFKIDANLFSYSKFLIQRNSSVFVIIIGSIPIAIGTIPATKESSEFSGDFNFKEDVFRLLYL